MSLGRQLMVLISGLVLVLLAGLWWIGVHHARAYLAQQLSAHALDTATALAMSLGPHLQARDRVLEESMVDAVFDSGYFQSIRLVDAAGDTLVARSRPVRVAGVPAWLPRWLDLPTPERSVPVMAESRQAGTLYVRSHPGHAYAQLWRALVAGWLWTLGSLALALLAAWLGVRRLLVPLRALESQADALGRHELGPLAVVPRTRELRRVVLAMNHMARRVEGMLAEQVALADHLREEAYSDSVTGTANRRAFDMRLAQLTSETEEPRLATLALIRLSGLAELNREHGYAVGDALIRGTAERLRQVMEDYPGVLLARVGGAELAVLAPSVSPAEGDGLAARLCQGVGEVRVHDALRPTCHIGVACYTAPGSAGELLARADLALRSATGMGPNAWYRQPDGPRGEALGLGLQAWRRRLSETLEAGELVVAYQPVQDIRRDAVLYYEVLARIPARQGGLLPAGQFVPMAQAGGLARALDREVIAAVLEGWRESARDRPALAINLSLASARDPKFLEWLEGRLAGHGAARGGLLFEISEYDAVRLGEALKPWSRGLTRLSVGLAVDRFGSASSSFAYLHGLSLEYLKLDGQFVRDIERDRDNQFYVRVLAEVAHGLDGRLLACAVESETEWEQLRALGVDGGQGRFLGRPMV